MTTLDTLCEKLIKTYNTTIIDQMPYVLQQALYNDTSSCSTGSYKQNEKDRTVLAELIHNHFTKKNERQQLSQHYIGGPCTLTCHWSEQFQKLIYIFGEEHSEETDCKEFPKNKGKNEEETGRMLIETYLKKFTEINDIYLDIYVEIPAYKQKTLQYLTALSETGSANIRLYKIGTEFAKCMDGYDRNKENCSRSRIHYIDIRNVEDDIHEDIDPISNFIQSCEQIINNPNQNENEKKNAFLNIVNTELGKYIMNGILLEKDSPEYLNFWYGMITNNSYVKKELDNCDKQMTETIFNFTEKELEGQLLDTSYSDNKQKTVIEFIKETAIFLHYSINDHSIEPATIIYQISILSNLLILVNSVIVDCYILCRIFKKFNLQPDNPQKRRTTDEPESPSNIIIYAGNTHCNRYRNFLKEIHFTLIAAIGLDSGKSSVKNCIDMTEHDIYGTWSLQPLFSAWPPPIQPSLLQQSTPFTGFGALPTQQSTPFTGFGALPTQQSTPFTGFGALPQQQSTPFTGFGALPQQPGGGFGLPSEPKKSESKKEREREQIREAKKLYEEDTKYSNDGKSNTKADHKKSARKNTGKPY
jgi:hypothetical protein